MKHINNIEITEEYKKMFQEYILQAVSSTFAASRLNENGQEYLGKYTDIEIVNQATKYMRKTIDHLPTDYKNYFIQWGCKFSDYTKENGSKVWDYLQ